ncbi:conjugal transfer protein TrbL [Brevibacterium sp. 50QC2O2]|uniref:conjugal transfer protein TrbL n=1 Tax=unclassified Brevibacterium TaxID=2614124 RepID=UPI00211C32D7|nr:MULTISPECIES: conjugal transfer protein TrbL [unclassified Brevibacterium]MCQ9367631.1 conjugal transfer protein TrbL [Brevibacterium sp. 91QC2O2]MCQ9389009.1 conjugal transfer protein TrbL [Brevibacterium sp. 50QC2O2]
MGVCDVPVISSVCDAAGEAAATLVSAPFDWLASTMGQAAGWLIEAMWKVFDSTTLVDVTAKGYLDVYNLLFGIGVLIVLLFFCFQLILGLIRREPSALARAALGAGKAILGSFLVITLTATALEIVDQLCIGIVQAGGETTGTMGDKIALLTAGLTGINIAAPGVGAIVTIFLAGLMICAVAIVWFSLLIRKALLLVAIVLAPVAFAGAAWDVTRSWIGKWAAFVVALIVSKLVLVVVFLIAITQVATPIEADLSAVTEPISGIVLLFIAAFAPYMVYRFISFLGFDLYHAMGTEQEAKNALNQPIPVPSKPQSDGVKKILDGGDGDGEGSGGSGSPSHTGGPPPTTSAPATGSTAATTETAGAGGGAAAAAGPAAAVIVAAEVVKDAAEAGPKLGHEVAGQAESAADAADQTGSPTPPEHGNPGAPPPSAPQPNPPSSDPAPPPSPPPAEPKPPSDPPAPQPPKE